MPRLLPVIRTALPAMVAMVVLSVSCGGVPARAGYGACGASAS
jgi:hypothetical protein